MNRTVRVDSATSDEFTAAIHWYEARRPGLGGRFHDRVADAIAKLETQPDIGSVVGGDPMTRRILHYVRRVA
ncbi:MAG: hypothetical protein ACYCX3_12125 [Thermoleophilia bacterium]